MYILDTNHLLNISLFVNKKDTMNQHKMLKPKAYLDTSVISALFDDRNPERKSLTEHFFKTIGFYEIYLSEITVLEINRTQDIELLNKMKSVTLGLMVISSPDDTEWLVSEYMSYSIVPEGYQEDAYHIAIAVLSGMDYLLSWNFKHIVRRKAKDIIRMVNSMYNLKQIEIMTPAELL